MTEGMQHDAMRARSEHFSLRDRMLYVLVSIKQAVLVRLWKKSFSQFGEDVVIQKLLSDVRRGFYIDIGAYHPIHYSNTYALYRAGWHGINVDANPESVRLLKLFRRRDVTVHAGVGSVSGSSTLYVMNHRAMSTFDPTVRDDYLKKKFVRLMRTINVPIRTLADICAALVPKDQEVHLLSIDVEGLCEQVLRGNDWTRIRPRVIAIELDRQDLADVDASGVHTLLTSQGYRRYCVCTLTAIYKRNVTRPTH